MASERELFRVVVGAVIYDPESKKFLLGKRHAKSETNPNRWSIPAGHVEASSHSIDVLEENLKREVQEEMGVKIKIEKYLDSHVWVDPTFKKVTVIFLCVVIPGHAEAKDGTDAIGWFSLEETNKLDTPPHVLRILAKASKIM